MRPALNSVLLGFMVAEAQSMLDTAKAYKAAMDALPDGDNRKLIYEDAIRFLLSRSSAMSRQVVALA